MVYLTQREIEVGELVIQGYTSKQIAEILFISIATVNKHMGHMYEKMGLFDSDFRAIPTKRLRFAFAFIKYHYNINFNFMVSNPFYGEYSIEPISVSNY